MSVEQSVEWELAEETEVLEKTCSSATLSTTNSTWLDLGSNPGHHGGKRATNSEKYGTASQQYYWKLQLIYRQIQFLYSNVFQTAG
jgi:hypothetical protein